MSYHGLLLWFGWRRFVGRIFSRGGVGFGDKKPIHKNAPFVLEHFALKWMMVRLAN